jgi:hypothetical protein
MDSLTTAQFNGLEKVKTDLVQAAEGVYDAASGKAVDAKLDDIDSGTRLLIEQRVGMDIQSDLKKHVQRMLQMTGSDERILSLTPNLRRISTSDVEFDDSYKVYHNLPLVADLCILDAYQQELLMLENQILVK